MGGRRYSDTPNEFDWDRINHKKVYMAIGIAVAVIVIILITIFSVIYVKKRNAKAQEVSTNTTDNQVEEKGMPKEYEGYSVLRSNCYR